MGVYTDSFQSLLLFITPRSKFRRGDLELTYFTAAVLLQFLAIKYRNIVRPKKIVMENNEGIDFRWLEKEMAYAIEADARYQRENSAKFRAVEQRVGSYEEFRDIVAASHLKPLDRKDITGKRGFV